MNKYIVIFNYAAIYIFIFFVGSLSYAFPAARINADDYIRDYCHYNIEKLEIKNSRSVDNYLILENDEIKFVIIVVDGKKIIDAVELKK